MTLEYGQDLSREVLAESLLYQEQDVWRSILGKPIEIKPLPAYITTSMQKKLEDQRLMLQYIPALDLGTRQEIIQKGTDEYRKDLELKYPGWRKDVAFEGKDRLNVKYTRNLDVDFWKKVQRSQINFPELPGQWVAVGVDPLDHYDTFVPGRWIIGTTKNPYASQIGLADDCPHSPEAIIAAIEQNGTGLLASVGLSEADAQVRLLEALEVNLLGNRHGWGKMNASELTNTVDRSKPSSHVAVGNCIYFGMATAVSMPDKEAGRFNVFRPAIVFNP